MKSLKKSKSMSSIAGTLYDSDGKLSRPMTKGEYLIPNEIRIEDEHLVWDARPSKGRKVAPSAETLAEFIKLRGAPDTSIVEFAKKLGVLTVCTQHEKIVTHDFSCLPLTRKGYVRFAPLSIWRSYIELAYRLLSIIEQLHYDQPGKIEDWRKLDEYGLSYHHAISKKDKRVVDVLNNERVLIGQIINYWLKIGNVVLSLRWKDKAPSLILESDDVFGVLASQLLMAVSRKGDIALCFGCGALYQPKRRPRLGQRHYCQTCNDRYIPQRDAARDYLQRNRANRNSKA